MAPLLAVQIGLAACQQPGPPSAHSAAASNPRENVAAAARAPAAPAAPVASASARPAPSTAFGDLVTRLSEPDGPFFSDNTISNETSYLQIASGLLKHGARGGAYIGVGPEQNFSYIALTKPAIAFVVDIRRQNLVLHLLYKSIFEEATSRSHFLALLVGRPYDAASAPAADAGIAAVLAHAERLPPGEATFVETHARLRERIERDVALNAEDRKTLEVAHRSFLKGQLDLRFSLKEANGRVYPTLRALLQESDLEGHARGFLATEDAFRTVQTMQREGRIVPVVGDFAGDRAMPGIASYLRERGLTVNTFYVSNVEQYLFEPKVWPKWARNVAALPVDERSLFIRAYLDQGRRHPQQMKRHRTATVLQRITDFNERQAKKPWASFWSVSTERLVGDG
jgi:hypothetical protein